jgi:hypothetical protein
MKYLTLLAALVVSLSAQATNMSTTGTVVNVPITTDRNVHSSSVSQTVSAKHGSPQTQGQSQAQNQTTTSTSASFAPTSVSNNAAHTSVTNTPNQTASAASVAVMPTAVCSGTTAGGAQGASFGVSFGTSWTDANCMLLEQVRVVTTVLGDPVAASEMLCSGLPLYREARERLGDPCIEEAIIEAPASAGYDVNDPYIRHRLGLTPIN